MLGSMYSAVSGLSAHQTKMNVIGNNIANVNTYGYKSSRATFSDVFYQTINGASAPTQNSGGTNPTQLGYGSKVNSIDVINTRAGSATTDRALDVYINGDGYLPVKNSDGVIKYTRVGILNFDKGGNLVDSNGNMVLGFKLDPSTKAAQLNADGTTTVQNLVPISVKPEELEKYTGIAIGQNGEITAIKEGDTAIVPAANTGWINGAPSVTPTSLYQGPVKMNVSRAVTQTVPTTAANPVPVSVSTNADISTGTAMQITVDAGGKYFLTYQNGAGTPQTSSEGTLDTTTNPNTITFTGITSTPSGTSATVKVPVGTGYYTLPTAPATPTTVGTVQASNNLNIIVTTQDRSGATVTKTAAWDTTAGTPPTQLVFGDITLPIDATKFNAAITAGINDSVIANVGPGPGVSEKIANIAITKFINANALSQEGEGYYVATTNSGEAVATIPGNGGTGSFRAGALEMSNVDLSREFTEMIITQRGFQANTRMITVSDEMLSELVSMKR